MTKSRKILGFIGLVLALFMGALDATIVNIALPNIMEDLHTGLTDTSWVATIYVLAMSVFIITVSKLADIYGRKLVMLIGVVIFGIFSFACMVADSLLLLIIFRFFQGIGGAILTPIVLPMGTTWEREYQPYYCYYGDLQCLSCSGGTSNWWFNCPLDNISLDFWY